MIYFNIRGETITLARETLQNFKGVTTYQQVEVNVLRFFFQLDTVKHNHHNKTTQTPQTGELSPQTLIAK